MADTAHRGGTLSEMAATGTTMPNDAGRMNLLPSVPRPDQITTDSDEAFPDLSGAADNATDMPRRTKDIGVMGGVVSGTGNYLPAEVESKRLQFGADEPLAKGHGRYEKHRVQKESDHERYQGEGATADPVPGEEGDSQDEIRDRKRL